MKHRNRKISVSYLAHSPNVLNSHGWVKPARSQEFNMVPLWVARLSTWATIQSLPGCASAARRLPKRRARTRTRLSDKGSEHHNQWLNFCAINLPPFHSHQHDWVFIIFIISLKFIFYFLFLKIYSQLSFEMPTALANKLTGIEFENLSSARTTKISSSQILSSHKILELINAYCFSLLHFRDSLLHNNRWLIQMSWNEYESSFSNTGK